MRLVVMAYQDIGYVCLDELFSLGADIAAVVTHRDDPHEVVELPRGLRPHQAAVFRPPTTKVARPRVVLRDAGGRAGDEAREVDLSCRATGDGAPSTGYSSMARRRPG